LIRLAKKVPKFTSSRTSSSKRTDYNLLQMNKMNKNFLEAMLSITIFLSGVSISDCFLESIAGFHPQPPPRPTVSTYTLSSKDVEVGDGNATRISGRTYLCMSVCVLETHVII